MSADRHRPRHQRKSADQAPWFPKGSQQTVAQACNRFLRARGISETASSAGLYDAPLPTEPPSPDQPA